MAVPIAAVDEDHRIVTAKREVRFAGQAAFSKCVTEPTAMQISPNKHLRLGIS